MLKFCFASFTLRIFVEVMKIVLFCISILLATFVPIRFSAQGVSECNAISAFHFTNASAEVFAQSNNPLLADHLIMNEDDDLNESEPKEAIISKSATNSHLTFGPVIVKALASKSWSSKSIHALQSSLFIYFSVFRL